MAWLGQMTQQKTPSWLEPRRGETQPAFASRARTLAILAKAQRKGNFAMANRMTIDKRNTILRLLVEGNSIRSITRLMQTNIPSVLRQLLWAGDHCRELMDSEFRGLDLDHLEVD